MYWQNELPMFNSDTYSYDFNAFFLRVFLNLGIGFLIAFFVYKSEKILSNKSIRIHIVLWIFIYLLMMSITPLAVLNIIKGPSLFIDLIFYTKFIYLKEQTSMLIGLYSFLLLVHWFKGKKDAKEN